MLVLERLLPYLFARDHKVLIFSQFKVTLDILEDWASLHHRWEVCRIDGGVSQASRRAQIAVFNMDPGVRLFLLSTRAGGQGINLVAADTVVLFDSDWNPQQDLQAQDRAHRIGQTRPVIVYRLATRGTVETSLLAKADGKRRLEKLVIRKGRFRSLLGRDGGAADADADADMRELARLLEVGDGERFVARDGVLTEAELAVLTDRSDGAYARAERGEEAAGERFRAVEAKPAGVLEDLTTKG
jgi:ATP-dependent DNA helicase